MSGESTITEETLEDFEVGNTVCVIFTDVNEYSSSRVEETNQTLEKFRVEETDPLVLRYDKYANNGTASGRLRGERVLVRPGRGLVAHPSTSLDTRFLGPVQSIYRPASDVNS